MLKTQRWENVCTELSKKRSIAIETVMKINQVSRSTARRDLEEMEKAGLLQRIRGGAIPVMTPGQGTAARQSRVLSPKEYSVNAPTLNNESEPAFMVRQTLFQDEKRRIAMAAHDLVRENETLILGGGTTILELAKTLYDIDPLYIATNDLQSALVLADYKNVDLTVLGGSQRKSHYSMDGFFTEQMISQMHADKTFIGIDAVDFNVGYMNFSVAEISTNKMMLAASQQKIVLADHSKFEKVAFVNICKLKDIDLLITDRETRQEYLDRLKEMEINFITV